MFSTAFYPSAGLQEGDVAFIDMRGALGDLVSTKGDTNYDLSKVYQSLCGYDFFILDKDIDHKAARLLCDLKEVKLWLFAGLVCTYKVRLFFSQGLGTILEEHMQGQRDGHPCHNMQQRADVENIHPTTSR